MSFLSRTLKAFATGISTITTAVYNASVQIYKDIIGRPAELREEIPPMLSPVEEEEPPMLSPVEEPEISDISEPSSEEGFTIVNVDGLSTEATLEVLQQILDELPSGSTIAYNKVRFFNQAGGDIYLTIRNDVARGKILDRAQQLLEGVATVEIDSMTEVFNSLSTGNITAIGYKTRMVIDLLSTNNSGAFFKYYHKFTDPKLSAILKKLQIFHKDDPDRLNFENCFVYAVKDHLTELELLELKRHISTEFLNRASITKLANILDITIRRHYYEAGSLRPNVDLLGKSKRVVEVGVFDNHYFKIEEVPVSIRNINHHKTENFTPTVKTIPSKQLVKHLIVKNSTYDFLEEIPRDELFHHPEYQADSRFISGIDIAKSATLITEATIKEKKAPTPIVFFDFETYTEDSGRHIPYHLSYNSTATPETKITNISFHNLASKGSDIIETFLRNLTNSFGVDVKEKIFRQSNLIAYAHNLTYDITFIFPYLKALEILEKDGKIITATGMYYNARKKIKIQFKDSLRLIPMGLAKFAETFKLESQKEVMYYSMYNPKTMPIITSVPVQVINDYIQEYDNNSLTPPTKLEERRRTFWENIEKWNCRSGDAVNLLKYSVKYCELDIRVLRQGFFKFTELFNKINGNIRATEFFSLPSVANYHFDSLGCFVKCVDMDGFLGNFFQDHIVGGRTMLAHNKKVKITTREHGFNIVDFDAVSLYPSAMAFFDGFVQGLPKELSSEQKTMEFLATIDYFFIEVLITKVGRKNRAFPCMSVKKADGTRHWTDHVEGEVLKFDKIGLEDAINFHEIEFTILNGYYFNEGFNTSIKDKIRQCFNERVAAKKADNGPLSELLKLVMNSSYGKTIQKPAEDDTIVINTKVWNKERREYDRDSTILDKFLDKNYQYLDSPFYEIDNSGTYHVKRVRSIVESKSKPHLGCQILSYSKRIMNQVMFLAEDIGVNIFYQDTDSLHMSENDLSTLTEAYKAKYGRDLVGSDLGQFHSDFEFSCKECEKKAKGVHSEVFIGCGKKCYLDVLIGKCHTEGCINQGKKIRDEHIRLKGVPKDAVIAFCEENNKTPEQVFNLLFGDDSITFDCGANNKARFEKGKDMVYTSSKRLTRTICFSDEKKKELAELKLTQQREERNTRRVAEGKQPFTLKVKAPKEPKPTVDKWEPVAYLPDEVVV